MMPSDSTMASPIGAFDLVDALHLEAGLVEFRGLFEVWDLHCQMTELCHESKVLS